MEQHPGKTCEGCSRKKATHHVCQPGAVPHSISLCDECMKTHAPVLVKDFMESVKDAVCRYCGNKAMTVDSLFGIAAELGGDPGYLCFSCSTEANRVSLEKFQILETGSESLSSAEQVKRLREITEQIDAHMRRWVIQRDN